MSLLALLLFINIVIRGYEYLNTNDLLTDIHSKYNTVPNMEIGTKEEAINGTLGNGDIGDFLGGYFGIWVGLLTAILTFLAFYVQAIANNKVQKQFLEQQFENRIYKMIDIFVSNRSRFNIFGYKNPDNVPFSIDGINKSKDIKKIKKIKFIDYTTTDNILFSKMHLELECIFIICSKIVNKHLGDGFKKDIFKISYYIFFKGLSDFEKNLETYKKDINANEILYNNDLITDLLNEFKIIIECHKKNGTKIFENYIIDSSKKGKNLELRINYVPFKGHKEILSQYYRSLFSIVDNIVNTDIKFNHKQKLSYLKILRSSLSEYEQLLLLYNWYCGFGSVWENHKNKFLSKYKMVDNIDEKSCIISIDIPKEVSQIPLFKNVILKIGKELIKIAEK